MDPLSLIQWVVASRLGQDPIFQVLSVGEEPMTGKIPVVTEHIGDIESAIQRAISQIGICVIVLTATAGMEFQDALDPYLKIDITVAVQEQVTLNRGPTGTGFNAIQVACVVAALLHNWTPPVYDAQNTKIGASSIIGKTNDFINLIPDNQGKGLLMYNVEFETRAGISYPPAGYQLNAFPIIPQSI